MQQAIESMDHLIATRGTLQQLLQLTLDEARRLTGASSASCQLWQRASDELHFVALSGEQSPHAPLGARIAARRGVVGDVLNRGRSALVNEPESDARFLQVVDRASGFVTHNLLIAPLDHQGRRIGAISLLNKDGGFTETDRDHLNELCAAVELRLPQLSDVERQLGEL